VATTDGGGAGAVRVRGVPSGGVSGAGAAADDVGSVIDFLSGAGFVRVRFYRKLVALRALSSKSTRRWLPQCELRESDRDLQGARQATEVCRFDGRHLNQLWVRCVRPCVEVLTQRGG
jgi:hypothetical protein